MFRSAGCRRVKSAYTPRLPWFLSSLLWADAAGEKAAIDNAKANKMAKRFMSFLLPNVVYMLQAHSYRQSFLGTEKHQHAGLFQYDAPPLREVGWPKQLFLSCFRAFWLSWSCRLRIL